jgi:hypothetical protein
MRKTTKTVYTLKRSRVGKAQEYHSLGSLIISLYEILNDREKSGFLGKVWVTIETIQEEK